MKNIITTILLLLITTTSIAQENALNFTEVNNSTDDIITIEDNDSIENELDFRYYYFPNLYAYYDLETNEYIYKLDNKWQVSSELPQYYGGYSVFKNLKMPITNYIGDNPQENFKEHKTQFPYIKKSRILKSLKIDGNTSVTNIN